MRIDCISDLHGHFPQLDGGDLLIVAGDLTARDEPNERLQFLQWLANQNYRKIVFIGGNHDNSLVGISIRTIKNGRTHYLCDSGTEFEGLKIWGSPWTKRFDGENPRCLAFTCKTEEELAEKFALIPDDTDILVTHSPPFLTLDKTISGEHVGSFHLTNRINIVKPRLHIFGHIHESYGEYWTETGMGFINASHVNERYEPVNKPVRFEI